ncbi:small integral membrane protein 4-like [Penaeus chinensis]|uniref:small integral membrane protein 4-like n=1 Tax=Penaeus chinensis TaxID=139456 RepID=UPI001FB762CE|nr:small integral membrane protein 4-like [Penaeus chinensis]XP_047471004.1 small integral membrane protein 4-like [Penaeus chinensis]
MRIRLYNARLRYVLDKWPGKRYLGMYRFLPMFFVLGAALEFSMINWHVGEVNFYRTYKKRQAQDIALQELQDEGLLPQ